MNFTDWENENPFKRQRIRSSWKLRRGWEVGRLVYMYQKNESDHELRCTIKHPTGSKRKRESTEPFFSSEPIPSQQNDMMNNTDAVFSDPVLFNPENVEQVGGMVVLPNLIDSFFRRDEIFRESPLFSAQLALKHLLAQTELSIQLQESTINNQKITIQQLGQAIQNFERLLQEIF